MTGRELPAPYYADDFVTIYHGDARELLPRIEADVLVTDPPYGQGYRGTTKASGSWGEAQSSCASWDADTSARDTTLEAWSGKPALVFGTWKAQRPTCDGVVVWHKTECGYGPQPLGPWANTHEEIYVLGAPKFIGRRGGSVVAFQPPPPGNRTHPTEKPVALMRYLIERCPPGVVVDPFMGSGTTLRAAKDLGRKAIGIELDERWCAVAARRMGQEVLNVG